DRRSPYWTYNFQIHGHRFYGSTKKTTRREAEAVERAEREKAKALVAQLTAARTSLKLDDIAGRYWEEVGQYHAGANNTERQIGYLIEFFGKDKIVTEITDDDVARMVAGRRGHQRRSQRTSNRSQTEQFNFTVHRQRSYRATEKIIHAGKAVGRHVCTRAAMETALARRAERAGA